MAKFKQGNLILATGKKIILGDNQEQEIYFNSTSGQIEFDPPAPGSEVQALSDLSDVDTVTTTDKNVLVANGSIFQSRELVPDDIGLGNVPNIDCTNASNITTGVLASSVLPPIALTDVYTVSDETSQLALTVQEGDVCVRSDLNRSYIAKNSTNSSMSDWLELATPTDSVLSVNGETGTVVLTQDDVQTGTTYVQTHNDYTDTEKSKLAGIESGATADQTASEIKSAYESNSDTNAYTDAEKSKLSGIEYGATADQTNSEIKVAYESNSNTNAYTDSEKVKLSGIEDSAEVNNISDGNATSLTNGTSNTLHYHNSDRDRTNHTGTQPVSTLSDFTDSVTNHSVVASNTAHRNTTSGNPHVVTKSDVGLGNVPNIDCTNASNITSGSLPSGVLPPIALTDVYTVSDETSQLALTVQEGDVCVRSDLNRSYIAKNSTNSSMSDWLELATPTDSVLSVNGETGTVILSQDDVQNGVTYVQTHNDYTDIEKSKLAGIESGAEVNVVADWNSTSGDSQILNKPSIPVQYSDLTGEIDCGVLT